MNIKKIFAVLISAFVLIGCEDTPKSDKPVVNIVALLPMSGDAAIYGQTSKSVADWYVSEFEKQNPNAKYKYNVEFEDIQLNPNAALNAVNKRISMDNVDVFANILSSVAQVITPITDKNKITTFNFCIDDSGNLGDYNFRITVDTPAGVTKMVEKLKKDGIKKVAVVNQIEVSHIVPSKEVMKQLKENTDIIVTGHYEFNAGEKDFTLLVHKIAAEKPDMIIVSTNPPESDLFAMAIKKQNIDIPLTGFQFPETVIDKKLVEGMWGLETATANEEFKSEFNERIGSDSTYYSEYVYAMLMLITNAYEKIGTDEKPTPSQVIKSINENTDGHDSPFGKLELNKKTGDIFVPTLLRQIIDGKPTALK